MTADELALLRGVEASPDDDLPRLVYADWLDERDDVAKAAYLRLVAESRTRDDFGSVLPQIIAAGAPFDFDWRDVVASRFEIVYLGAAQSWEHYILHALERAFRCNRVELAPLRQAAPAVLYDCLTPDAAAQSAESWTDECVRMITPPRQIENQFYAEQSEMLRSQLGDAREAWFVVRPMGTSAPPMPFRFEVVVAGRFDAVMSQPHLDPAVFVSPLQAVFGLTEDDVRWMMYSGGSVPVRRALSFADALGESAEFNKVLKRHTMAQSLRELVSIDIRPESAAFSPPPDGG